MSRAGQSVQFELNGAPVTILADAEAPLLEALRSQLNITSPKNGCSPEGSCGCCTVLIDGLPRLSCTIAARRVTGARVTTLEGLSADERRQLADSFAVAGAVQCGFCTPASPWGPRARAAGRLPDGTAKDLESRVGATGAGRCTKAKYGPAA